MDSFSQTVSLRWREKDWQMKPQALMPHHFNISTAPVATLGSHNESLSSLGQFKATCKHGNEIYTTVLRLVGVLGALTFCC